MQPGSIALLRGGAVLGACALTGSLPGPTLLGELAALLGGAGVALTDVGAFAVSTGPGAFTGLRVGLATVKGLAYALGRPVVGVSTLRAHALRGVRALGVGEPGAAYVPILDARRGEVYAAAFTAELAPLLDPRARTPEALGAELAAVGRPLHAFGGGATLYAARLGLTAHDDPSLQAPHAAEVAELAFASWPEGAMADAALFALAPAYVRAPDAEVKARP